MTWTGTQHQRDYGREYMRRWNAMNYERVKAARNAARRARYAANPEPRRREAMARDPLRRAGGDPVTVVMLTADPCAYCREDSETLDHIVPLNAGGESIWHNLTGACRSCNGSKQDKRLLMFLLHRR